MKWLPLTLVVAVLSMLPHEASAASKAKKKKPAGSVVSAESLYDVTSDRGVIKCLQGTPPRAGKIKSFRDKIYFTSTTKEYAGKIAKVRSSPRLSKKRKSAKILALKTERDALNNICQTGVAEPPSGIPLPSECVDLAEYQGTWDAGRVQRIYEKAAWGATQNEIALSVAAGLDATIDNHLLRLGGLVPTPELDQKLIDWRDNELGNLGEQDPYEIRFDGVRYGEVENFITNPNPFQTHLLHLIHQKIAASYRVLDGNERHLFFTYRDMLLRFVNSGDYGALIREASNNELYMLIWLNLGDSDAGNPNEDGPRELLQLVGMGQFNAGDPNRGMNYTSEDIHKVSLAMVEGWSVKYDNQLERSEKTLTPAKAYQGPPLTIGAGTPWQRDVRTREDVLQMILSRKETAYDIARWMLESYAYRNPPVELIRSLGEIIYADNFKLYTRAFPMLLKSRAINSSCATDAIAKDPAELMVGLLRSTGLPMDPDDADEKIRRAGLTIWNPVTVFGYTYDNSFSARQQIERQNGIIEGIRNTSYQEEHGWTFEKLFPASPTAGNVIDNICGNYLGVDLVKYPVLREQLLGYADFIRENDGDLVRRQFDYYEDHAIDPESGDIDWKTRYIWEPKAHGFLQICAMTPFYQSK